MTTAAQVLKSKPVGAVFTTTPEALVFDAVRQMAERNVGALVVLDGGSVVGVVSERDYARKVMLLARSSRETRVRDIMSSPVMYVRPTQTVEECMALMTDRRLRHLPVIDDGTLLGVISIGDLVKQVIADQKFIIEQLAHYISGQTV
ncbi:MAG TPA: CBS domain-containing protein [Steroidobacteraceae bacterium]|nr:CBS domain-containing protein [Steroidobacteraceae bacterium]